MYVMAKLGGFLFLADEQGGLPMYVSAPGLVQQILQLQTELQSLQDEVHHSLLQDKHQCLNNL
jgi:HAUS augmin-like complex subunit 3